MAIGPDGTCFVSEAGAGRVVELTGSGVETVLDGLQRPQGILVRDGQLYVVDAGAKELIEFDLESKARRTIAAGLPVGAPPGVVPKPLRGLPPFSGPQGPFAGIAAGPDGTLYLSADAEGSVLALRPDQGARRDDQTSRLPEEASGHDDGRVHGLLREPALAAVETMGAKPSLPNAQRYVRRYVTPEKNPLTGEVIHPGYDCIMEIWWNTREDSKPP